VLKLCYPDLLKNASLLSSTVDFICQQDGAPTRTEKLAQDWIVTNCSEFSDKDEWPPNSPDVNPVDYHVWGVMFDTASHFVPRKKRTFMD